MSSNTRSPHRQAQASPLGDQIRDLLVPLRDVLASLEPRDVPLPFAEDVMNAFLAVERLGAAGASAMKPRVVEYGAWKRSGAKSPAEWLAERQGTSVGRARVELEAAERLEQLPLTAGEVRAGRLSVEQAGVVADAAVVNPGCEQELIDTAKSDSLKHTREQAERRKAEAESELSKREREAKIHRERSARFWSRNGRAGFSVVGPLTTGAMLEQAVSNRVGEIWRQRRTGEREGRDQYAYDALMELLGFGETTADTVEEPTAKTTGPVKNLMLIRVDLAALINGDTGPGDVCEIPGAGTVSVDEARRLFGDAVVRLITTNGPAVIDVVNLSRKLTARQEFAKLWTDAKCVVAGCNRTVRIENEHRIDFATSKRTVLADVEHMCNIDHLLKTTQNWQLVPGTGRRQLVPPGHPLHPDTLRENGPNADAPDPPPGPPNPHDHEHEREHEHDQQDLFDDTG